MEILREKRRARRPDIGVGRLQRVFCRQDVGTTRQQVGRQAFGNVMDELILAELGRRGQIARQRRTQQELQRIARLRIRALGGSHVGAHRIELQLGLLQFQFGRHAAVEQRLDQIVALPWRAARVRRISSVNLVGQAQVEIRLRRLRHQPQLHGALGLLGGKIVLIGRFAEVAHPAEEVQLERRHGYAGQVDVR